ncbi:hypothetical protein BKA83DRAFT_2871617 [Pisolithus microcarpus]|nr:hypothetical protein BKA83DRAFT_2871617 [Pisolithus microcarpus]
MHLIASADTSATIYMSARCERMSMTTRVSVVRPGVSEPNPDLQFGHRAFTFLSLDKYVEYVRPPGRSGLPANETRFYPVYSGALRTSILLTLTHRGRPDTSHLTRLSFLKSDITVIVKNALCVPDDWSILQPAISAELQNELMPASMSISKPVSPPCPFFLSPTCPPTPSTISHHYVGRSVFHHMSSCGILTLQSFLDVVDALPSSYSVVIFVIESVNLELEFLSCCTDVPSFPVVVFQASSFRPHPPNFL